MSQRQSQQAASPPGIGVMVLGMHRSGTSALAGTLGLLGVELGKTMVRTEAAINEKGYWENLQANRLDDHMLKYLGTDWYDPRELPANWEATLESAGFAGRLAGLLREDFSGGRVWAVKDPRLCRLLPFWLNVLNGCGIESRCLIVLRHPDEVSRSLQVRNGFGPEHAYLLYLRYLLDAELASRFQRNAVLTFEHLLGDWRKALRVAAEALALDIPVSDPELGRRVDNFLEGRLRHHVAGPEPTGQLQRLAIDAYEAVQLRDTGSLQVIRGAFNQRLDENRPWIEETAALQKSVDDLTVRADETERRFAEYVQWVENSVSWRLTGPLRLLARWIGRRSER